MKATVLFFSTSSGPGGAERLISKLAGALDRRSFRLGSLSFSTWLAERPM